MKKETKQAAEAAEENEFMNETETLIKELEQEPGETILQENKEFEPMLIGESDDKSLMSVTRIYDRITKLANELKEELEECLKINTPYTAEAFIQFLKADTKTWVFNEFIRINDIKPLRPGENLHVVLDSGSIPAPNMETVLELKNSFKELIENMGETKYYYPLIKLWSEESKEFNTTENDFFEDAILFFSWFTLSPNQNQVLTKLQNVCEALNELVKLEILRPKNGVYEFDVLAELININRAIDSEKAQLTSAFSVSRNLFLKNRMSRFGGKTMDFHNNQDKLQFRKKENIYETV